MDHSLNHPKPNSRGFRKVYWTTFLFIGLALIALPTTGLLPSIFLYNPSESAPQGWYRIEALEHLSRGDQVVSNLPQEAAEFASLRGYLPRGIPVIKTVAALEDDTVCETGGVLEIDDVPTVRVLAADKAGRPLPSPWRTCRRLLPDEVLLLSDRTQDSFDGRYFGAIQKTDIIGRAIWMSFAEQSAAEVSNGQIGGRSECKIKAHGANEGASPCLHIDFYGSIPDGIAPWSDLSPNKDNRFGWFHSGELACFPPDQLE
ncbi:S26 family signal peptidase [Hyphomonas sp. ND6WE1B]|uniref:S26 family signal peptidase n=1 Tax=Hyphomonas sp. ND6WE1B TaxID=1848191 RepID=UPI0015856870|nr:S26 family signal peptidase [Hyphomonas sp. ND6WE1B]